MRLDFQTYRKKVYGCYIGKAVGGTLGMPFEGDRSVRKVTYYDPVPTEMPPNDDLDLQVVNLETVMRLGLPISRLCIGEMWIRHLDDSCDEYGVAISNHDIGLRAPLSGIYRNKFKAGMGGAIRSELWACLAPGNPALAAMFAREDASTDHAQEGVFAEMFLAAAESAAFTEIDLSDIIDAGMNCIDKDSKLYRAFTFVRGEWETTRDVMAVREKILTQFASDNWTDVTINLSFILLALLVSEGNFDKAVCTAASLGYDTDCTAATVGAFFGIWKPDAIDKKWTDPIGNKLVLSPCIVGMHECDTVDEFCNLVMGVEREVSKFYGNAVTKDFPAMPAVCMAKPRYTDIGNLYGWENGSHESLIAELPFLVSIIYPDTVALLPNQPNKIKIRLQGNSEKTFRGTFSLISHEKLAFVPSVFAFSLCGNEMVEFETVITESALKRYGRKNVFVLRFDINGVSFVLEAGLPLAYPWEVTDGRGNKSVFWSPTSYFTVPDGSYIYRTKIKAPAKKDARMVCCGTRPFKCFINGEEVRAYDGALYVPAFHRDHGSVRISLENGENEVEIVFSDYKEGECFVAFGTTFGGGLWSDTVEWYL